MLETAKLVMLRVFLLRLMLLRSCQMEEKMSREAEQLGGYPGVFLLGLKELFLAQSICWSAALESQSIKEKVDTKTSVQYFHQRHNQMLGLLKAQPC